MMRIILFLFCFTFSLSHGSSKEKLLIAINDLERQNMDESTSNIITDRLRTELFKTGAFSVLERSQMKQILEEQEFQQSDCTSSECAVEAGQLLGVTHMMTGVLGKVGKTFTINIRLIDVATGKIVMTDNTDCQCEIDEVLAKSTVSIAQKAASFISPDQYAAPEQGPQKKTGFWKSPWPYIAGGTVMAGTGAVIYLIMSSPEAKETNLGTIVPEK